MLEIEVNCLCILNASKNFEIPLENENFSFFQSFSDMSIIDILKTYQCSKHNLEIAVDDYVYKRYRNDFKSYNFLEKEQHYYNNNDNSPATLIYYPKIYCTTTTNKEDDQQQYSHPIFDVNTHSINWDILGAIRTNNLSLEKLTVHQTKLYLDDGSSSIFYIHRAPVEILNIDPTFAIAGEMAVVSVQFRNTQFYNNESQKIYFENIPIEIVHFQFDLETYTGNLTLKFHIDEKLRGKSINVTIEACHYNNTMEKYSNAFYCI